MRFVRGETLREAIARFHEAPPGGAGARRLALARLVTPLLSACRVAAYAHGRGVLHRDLKPGNILVTPHGESLVVDWGIAKMLDRHDPGVSPVRPSAPGAVGETILHRALGTPHYMSPEQAAGVPESLGPPTDVYGLGATLYEVLAGRAPFDDVEDPAAVLDAVRRGDLRPPRSFSPDAPAELEAICLRAMALRPEDRYPSPAAMADDLEGWLVGESPASG
jgi:serine/threonine protein kinase